MSGARPSSWGGRAEGRVRAGRPRPRGPRPAPPRTPHAARRTPDLSALHRARRQLHAREGVHGSLHRIAADAGSLVEDLLRELGLGRQLGQHRPLLLRPWREIRSGWARGAAP